MGRVLKLLDTMEPALAAKSYPQRGLTLALHGIGSITIWIFPSFTNIPSVY